MGDAIRETIDNRVETSTRIRLEGRGFKVHPVAERWSEINTALLVVTHENGYRFNSYPKGTIIVPDFERYHEM